MCEFCGCGMQRAAGEQRGFSEVVMDANALRAAVRAARAAPDRPRPARQQAPVGTPVASGGAATSAVRR